MSKSDTPIQLEAFVEMKHHNIALLFCNFLISQKITAQVEAQGNGFVVYCDPAQLEKAKTIFEDFVKQPNHPKYQDAAWGSGEVSTVRDNGPSVFSQFKEQFFRHAGVVTLIIFIACWIVFLLSIFGWGRTIFNEISFYNPLSLNALVADPFRLIGAAFFHFGWLHIVFNTMWWWQLGGEIERTLGKGALINLFFVTAVLSNFGQFIVSGPNFGGLSGVVYGLFGYVWWYGWLAPEKGLTISKPIVGFLLFFMLLGFANVLPVNMANTAHLLGLMSGCGLAWFRIKTSKS